MKKLLITLTMFLLLALVFQLNAQIPRTLSYQGVLTDQDGKPRPDNNYQFTFCLYDTATGGSTLWTEQKTLPVTAGLFSTILGDQKPFGAAVKFDEQYWLGIQVGNEAELSPRIQLTSVGYSLNAVRADTAMVAVASMADTTWEHSGANIYRINGNIGIGISDPTSKLSIGVTNWTGVESELIVGEIDRHRVAGIYHVRENDYTGNSALTFRTTTGNDYSEKMRITHDGGIGIGTSRPDGKFDVWGDVYVGSVETGVNNKLVIRGPNCPADGTSGQDLSFEFAAAGSARIRALRGSSWDTYLQFLTNDGNTGNDNPKLQMEIASDGIKVTGRTKTQVLEITGGSDIAEPFEISHTDSLPLGSLVVIDSEHRGKLKQAVEAYDKRVAGVISGAGGVNPGLTLTQEGKLDGSQHVALTGKVYALATAANGAIEPGDLLTTSGVPGHAMKATDKELWPGSVIGKAMSGLKEGEGLVLVLIQPH